MYKHVILFFFYWSFSIDVRISFITKGGKRRSNQKKENEKKTKERGANSSQEPFFFALVPIYCWLKFHLLTQSISRNRSRSIDETDNDCEGSKERRKGLNIPLVILYFLHDEMFLCLYSVHICIYDFILCVKIF